MTLLIVQGVSIGYQKMQCNLEFKLEEVSGNIQRFDSTMRRRRGRKRSWCKDMGHRAIDHEELPNLNRFR